MQLPLSPQVFSILSALVAEHAGLHFGVEHMSVFADKIGGRAVEAGFESLLDYYYFLRYDPGGPAELDALLEALVVNETYLFRELSALETMVTEFILPGRERREAAPNLVRRQLDRRGAAHRGDAARRAGDPRAGRPHRQ